MDCIVALSACPHDIFPVNGADATPRAPEYGASQLAELAIKLFKHFSPELFDRVEVGKQLGMKHNIFCLFFEGMRHKWLERSQRLLLGRQTFMLRKILSIDSFRHPLTKLLISR